MIDLSADPKERFKDVANSFKQNLLPLYDKLVQAFPQEVITQITDNHELLRDIDPDRFSEMEGIAEALGVDTWKVVLQNILQVVASDGTAVIARLSDDSLILERIFDLKLNLTRDIIYKANFIMDGEPWFEAEMMAGEVGVYHGMWNQTFAFAVTRRRFDLLEKPLPSVPEDLDNATLGDNAAQG